MAREEEAGNDLSQQWSKHTGDYKSGTWAKDVIETPFLQAHFKSFAEKRRGEPWRALDVGCGNGKYSVKLLEAGASYLCGIDPSVDMVNGARQVTDDYLMKLSHQQATGPRKLELPRAEFFTSSATELRSMAGVQEESFDLAISIFVFCNLNSIVEVKQSLTEIYNMLKPGAKLMFYEPHPLAYLRGSDGDSRPGGGQWTYFEDEGQPHTIRMKMNSGKEIEFINRFYTLSSWVSSIVEAGFVISQFHEPHLNPQRVPAAEDKTLRYFADHPTGMFVECTKPA